MRITLPSGTQAELARPESASDTAPPHGGLVVVPDIMGLRGLFDEHCARLARERQVVVCAPEVFPGYEDEPLDWRMDHAGAVDDPRRLADIVAAADATGAASVAILGFCMGGMLTLKASGTGRFRRAVAFYGMIRTPEAWRTPDTVEPLDAVTAPGACPVLALLGGDDSYTPAEDVAALEQTGATVVSYPGAGHGFVHDASRPSHRADDAADAWARAYAFLEI
jgi:carboxymethylenebutenolidase